MSKKSLLFCEILNQIEKYDSIIILRHIKPDGDALGSQFALKTFIENHWPSKKVFAPGEPSPVARLNFLGTPDEISLDCYKNSLVIIVDTAISKLISAPWDFVKKNAPLIIRIDHHPLTENLATIECIDDQAPSTTQLLGEFLLFTKKQISSAVAEKLYTGLLTDSYRMNYGLINHKTFRVLESWGQTGFSVEKVNHHLYNIDDAELKLRAYILNHIQVSSHENVVYAIIPSDVLSQYPEFDLNTATYYLIDSFVLSRNGKIWLLMASDNGKNRYIKGEIRALNQYPVDKIAQKYGGGGHAWAAAVRLSNPSEIASLLKDLDNISKI